MAGELQVRFVTGKTVYFLVRNSVGQIYNGATFETYVTGNYANYPISGTEQGTSGFYTGTFPAVASGIYSAEAVERLGGSPAESDANVGNGDLMWDGAATANLASWAVALLKQTFVGITGEGSRSVLNALRKLMNRWSTVTTAGKLTVYKEDDTVVAYTQDLVTDADAEPVVSLDTN